MFKHIFVANWFQKYLPFGRHNHSHNAGNSWFPKFGWSIFGGAASFNDYNNDVRRLQMVLSSPAALKVISLLCDLYSLGKIYVYKDGKEVEGAPELELFDQPNPFQTQAQWKWTYMFWTLLGNSNLYIDKNIADASNKMYWLIPSKIEWPQWFETNRDKLIFSSSSLSTLESQQLKYRYDDGSSIDIPFKKVVQYFDLSNGIGNWFIGNSRLDALCKIINISESALNAKKINVEFSAKFLVGGVSSAQDVNPNKRPLSKDEKGNIEEKVLDFDNPVHTLKNMLEVHRFVSDLGALKLDEAYLSCALQISDLFQLPKEVISLLTTGSTFENQEKAKGLIASYCLEPRGEDMCGPISKRCLFNKKKKFVISWDHCSFSQYAESDRADVQLKRSITIRNLQQAGASTDEINAYLDTNFENLTTSNNEQTTDTTAAEEEQSGAGN